MSLDLKLVATSVSSAVIGIGATGTPAMARLTPRRAAVIAATTAVDPETSGRARITGTTDGLPRTDPVVVPQSASSELGNRLIEQDQDCRVPLVVVHEDK